MKELELVISGLRVDMPHKVIDYRMVDVLEALDKRLTALEGDGEDNAEVIQGHQLRLTALEEIAHEHIGYSDPPVKPSCYREKKTCGECARPFWNEAFGNGWCLAGKQLPVDRDDEACADFIEATP